MPKGTLCRTQLSGSSGRIFRTPVQLSRKALLPRTSVSLRSPGKEDGLWPGLRPLWVPWPSGPSIPPTLRPFLTPVVPVGSSASCQGVGGVGFSSSIPHQGVRERAHVADFLWRRAVNQEDSFGSQASLPFLHFYRKCQAVYRKIPSLCT